VKNIALIFGFFILLQPVFCQVPVCVIDGERVELREFQIVVPASATKAEQLAAEELHKYIEIIAGISVAVVDEDATMKPTEFVIGRPGRMHGPGLAGSMDSDGFIIQASGTKVFIIGGSDKGALYGTYEFLEKYLGCRFWAPGAETIPATTALSVPAIDIRETPAFASREVYYAGMDEQDFTDKMRTDRHAWKGGENWGLWVHTMFSLVPPETYFDTHPEYYALMGGKRAKTQLCLTNPEVLQITIESLRARMNEKPDAKYWSVSQMDTYGSCECNRCKSIDNHEGSASGSMIAFVNQVAAAFPEKVISTLAYQYTRKAPKFIKPAANVNIMLCTIECDRSRPLDADSSAGSFTQDLRQWSAIASDILVWDYVIQFTNMIAPFPNLRVLQPNIRLFQKYHVNAVFEQGCHGTYSENQELRQYLLSKLLWNPGLNADSLTKLFLNGYYGAAGGFIDRYLQGMEQSLHNSGQTLWIYGSPMQETGSFLDPESIKAYNTLFDQAESAVASDSILLARVEKARLPLRYAIIEIAKKNITGPDGFMEQNASGWVVKPGLIEAVNEFVTLANRCGVKTVHERSLPPDVYGQTTVDFFKNAYTIHLAKDKPYLLSAQPAAKYSAEGSGSLTDGKRGSPNYYVLWQGFEGCDLSATIDMGAVTRINYLGAEFLQDLASWIFYPEKLVISVSENGTDFIETVVFDSISFNDPLLILETGKMIEPVNVRYVKFYAVNTGQCPAWHIGHGGKAWLFADELIVDYR
jgi:hypothetical protein